MQNNKFHRPLNVIDTDSLIEEAKRFMRQGDIPSAASICQQILTRRSNHPEAAYIYGLILCTSGDSEAGKPWLKIASGAMSKRADVIHDWATCLKICGETIGAEKNFRKALALKPDLPEAWDNLVDIYLSLGKTELALESCKKFLDLRPNDAEAWVRLCKIQSRLNLFGQAIISAKKSLEIDPTSELAEAALSRALIATGQGNAKHITAIYNAKKNFDLYDWQSFLFLLNTIPNITNIELAKYHFEFSEKLGNELSKHRLQHTNAPDPDRPLKIGFLSGDLRSHPVGYFMNGLLQHIDHQAFQLTAYANQTSFDATSARLKKHFPQWKDVAKLSDQSLHKMIAEDQIDILMDLSGHTDGNRLTVFAAKAAPIQVTYLGYFATTGLRSIDYILCNTDLIPDTEKYLYSEEPWFLPDTHLCYTPHSELPIESSNRNGKNITFGCFNKLFKINDVVLDTWAAILKKVETSSLLIICQEMDDDIISSQFLARFTQRGINSNRIKIEKSMHHEAYLKAHGQVDIMLDPFPYNGTTTTMDALWMGVPVLTLHGDRYGAHMAEAVLRQAGLQEWIAKDKEDYIRIATKYAVEPQELAALRYGMRKRLLSTPLLDSSRFAENFSAALRGMWRKWCEERNNPNQNN